MKHQRWLRCGFVLALVCSLLIATAAAAAGEGPSSDSASAPPLSYPQPWNITTIDDGRLISELGPTSLAYATNGYPHVAYGQDHLYHSYWTGSAWTTELIDGSPLVGDATSIAVDANGKVYITYYDEVNQDLKYATNWQGTWQVLTLASTGNVGAESYVFATAGEQGPEVYVGYLDSTNHRVLQLYSGEETNGAWSGPLVASGSEYVSSFAMTMRGYQSYISMSRLNTTYQIFEVWYNATSGGIWQTPEEVNSSWCSTKTAIAVDGSGTPHIVVAERAEDSYGQLLGWIIFMADRKGGTWSYPTYENLLLGDLYSASPYEAVSMRFSAADNTMIVALQLPTSDPLYNDLTVVTWLTGTDVVGASYDVQKNVYGDFYPAIATPANVTQFKAGVVYLSTNTLAYEYLTGSPAAWNESRSPVEPSSDRGDCNVLKIDNNGNYHLLYHREDNGALYYKYTNSLGWTDAISVTGVGEGALCSWMSRPSMELLSDGTPVVSYVNSSYQLKYAERACGRPCTFTRVLVDNDLSDGSTAIAILAEDNPSILYHTNNKLRFARMSPWGFINTPVYDSLGSYGPISVAVDNDGKLHAAFLEWIYDQPHYSKYDGTNWSTPARLETVGYTLDPVRIAINPVSNLPQVAYVIDDQLIINAYGCVGQLCLWFPNTVDAPTTEAGQIAEPSFLIDSSGRRMLSYYYYDPAQGQNGLKFMALQGANKSSQMVTSVVGQVGVTSLDLRPNGMPAIAFHGIALGQMNLALAPYGVYLPLIKR